MGPGDGVGGPCYNPPMATLFMTIGTVGLLMLGMAVGVIFSNKPLKGSCGGAAGALGGGEGSCACAEAGTPGACKTEGDDADTRFTAPGAVLTLRK